MALLNLETLVLRGSVGCDGLALNVRLGTSVKAGLRTLESSPSMRHPRGYRPIQPFGWPIFDGNPGPKPEDNPEEGAQPGAGRSRRHAGHLRRRTKPVATFRTDTTCTSRLTTTTTTWGLTWSQTVIQTGQAKQQSSIVQALPAGAAQAAGAKAGTIAPRGSKGNLLPDGGVCRTAKRGKTDS